MKGIGTISARALGPVLKDYLPHSKFNEIAFEGTDLPIDIPNDPDVLLPQFGAWRLVNRIALLERNPCFSYECVLQSSCVPNPLSALELKEGATDPLKLMCDYVDAINTFTPHTHFWWEIANGEFLFRRKPMDDSDREGLQVEFYALGAFASFLKHYVSDQVLPSSVFLRSPVCTRVIPSEWSRARICLDCPASGLAFPLMDIVQLSEHHLNGWLRETFASQAQVLQPEEEVYRFKKVVCSYLASGETGIDTIARALGLSTRTLQRDLARLGLSYSAILGELRMEIATQQLASSQLGIGEIASLLGYRHAGDFTRAFKNFAEMSPSSYREFNRKFA